MRFAIALLFLAASGFAQSSPAERAAWNRPVKPFRILGNVYYVGMHNVSAFLITTAAGHVLLDVGFPESAPLVEKSITDLGFKLSDVKFLLNSHAHYDHCGGLAALKSRSGATMAGSVDEACSPPVAIDRTIADGDTVRLGDAVLTAHLTPGHTKGCTTWSMPVAEGGRTYNAVFYCSTTVVAKLTPELAADYERTFAKLKQIPCDIFLAPHAGFFRLHEKAADLARGKRDAFVDSTEMKRYVAQSERAFISARSRDVPFYPR